MRLNKNMKIENIINLSPTQEGILYQTLLQDDPKLYNEVLQFDLIGNLNITLLEESFNEVIQRHSVLRTVFVYENVKFNQQVVINRRKGKVNFYDFTNEVKKEQLLYESIETISSTKFDLRKDILVRLNVFKLENEKYHIVFSFHHIILDGWSMGIVLNEIFTIYQSKENKEIPQLNNINQYFNYVKKLGKKGLDEAKKYWQKYLDGYDNKNNIPYINRTKAKDGYLYQELLFEIPEDKTNEVNFFCKKYGVTSNAFYETLVGMLLQRYNNNKDVVFGIVVSGRQMELQYIQNTAGLFISTVPLRVTNEDNCNFVDKVKNVQKDSLLCETNAVLSLADIQNYSELKNQLIRVLFTYENYPIENVLASDNSLLQISNVVMKEETGYDFNITVIPGDRTKVRVTYNGYVYDQDKLKVMENHFINLLMNVLTNNELEINKYDIMDDSEKAYILNELNGTDYQYQKKDSLQQIFEEIVEKYPDKKSVYFDNKSLTYKELNEEANKLAHYLKNMNVTTDTIVPIIFDRSLEMIISIYAIIKAGGAYLPISTSMPVERINYIINDCNTHVTIVQEEDMYKELENSETEVLTFIDKKWDNESKENPERICEPENIAYVIYTSGSTGTPKGVMIEHQCIINRLLWMSDEINLESDDCILQKTPYTFDVSVVEMFLWAFKGASMVLLKPEMEKNPFEIVKAVQEFGVTYCHFVPSMLKLFLDFVETDEDTEKLKSLRVVVASGEELNIKIAEDFKQRIYQKNKTLLYNFYGPTETAVDVTYYNCYEESYDFGFVPIGKPISNVKIYVLNEEKQLQPVGVEGEVYISGVNVGRGYVNLEKETSERFGKDPFFPENRMYKTGDLGMWMHEGFVKYSGRCDSQVKVRGFRIELGDIENAMIHNKKIQEAAVICIKNPCGDSILGAYYTAKEMIEDNEIKNDLKKHLPDYMIPSYFTKLDKMPLNSNGKLNVKALPLINCSSLDNVDYVAPVGELEEKVAKIWEKEMKLNHISTITNIFELGGHSIIIMRIIALMNKELGILVSYKEFIENGSIKELCNFIENKNKQENVLYPIVEIDTDHKYEPFKLTDIQMSYLLGRASDEDLGGVSTHLYLEIESHMDMERFNYSVNKVIVRHDMMRCIIDGNGYQRFLKEVPKYEMEIIDLSSLDEKEMKQQILKMRDKCSHHIFDTSKWPLFSFKAAKINEDTHILFVEVDPIIADAKSMQIVGKEILEIYHEKADLHPIEFSFRDYMNGIEQLHASPLYQRDKDYWLSKLDEFALAPNIPLVKKTEDVVNFYFSRLTKSIDKEKWDSIKKYCLKNRVSPIAFLVTCFSNILSYWSNEKKFTINFTVSNRYPFHKDIENIVGDFTSIMLIEIDYIEKETFASRLQKTHDILVDAIEHRHYDGVEFIRDIARKNKLTTQAIMPIVFTGNLIDNEKYRENPWKLFGEMRYGLNQTSQVYLDNQVVESDDGLQVTWDYVDELFNSEQISSMFEQYVESIVQFGERRKYHVSDKEMQILEKYNASEDTTIKTGLIHDFVMQASKRFPNNNAVVLDHGVITYQELDKQSNRVANWLTKNGVQVEDRICVSTYREIKTIVLLVGILKAGAAYIPVDYEIPEERKNYIKENSESRFVLDIKKDVSLWDNMQQESSEYHSVDVKEENLAYIIYTSGSTGKPKGVQIEHRSAVNTILDINKRYHVDENDRIIGISSMGFDLSVYDIFGSLFAGAQLVLVRNQKDIPDLIRVLNEKEITIWNSVPALMELVVDIKEDNDIENIGIQEPLAVFENQKNYFVNKYDENIVVDKNKLDEYKRMIHNRNYHYSETLIPLKEDEDFLADFRKRKTIRNFVENKLISLNKISKLLSVFHQFAENGEVRYSYASAGGLYPIDIYIQIKENRVDQIKKGLYYYNPKKHDLQFISDADQLDDKMHFFQNKEIFNSSAISVYLVYNAEANMPKYGSLGYFQACLDTGIMIQMLTQATEKLGMGMCSIGNMDYNVLKKALPLTNNQVIMHTIEIGLKDKFEVEDESVCEYSQAADSYEFIMNQSENKNSSLRLVMLSGDYIPLNLPDRIKKEFPAAKVISLGGATEGSIWSIYYPIAEVDSSWSTIPYGYPLANQKIYVLNENFEYCPIGVKGEICIGGIGVARGYDNNEKQTNASFWNHKELGYIYKTGDYGIMREQGYIEFAGRKDLQVKIRGMRIELEEIESCLLNHSIVKNVKATVVDSKGSKEICLYYVGQDVDKEEIENVIRENLPVYMIPKFIVKLEKMPLTLNGKVDVKSLPNPELMLEEEPETIFTVAESEIEKELAGIWCSLLGVDQIDVNQNFFELGGNSITLIKAHAQVDKLYKDKIKLVELFNYPTIKSLASELKARLNDSEEIKELSGFQFISLYEKLDSESEVVNLEVELDENDSKKLNAIVDSYHLDYLSLISVLVGLVYAKASNNGLINIYQSKDGKSIQELTFDFDKFDNLSDLLQETSNLSREQKLYMIDEVRANRKEKEFLAFVVDEGNSEDYSLSRFTEMFTYIRNSNEQITMGCKFDRSKVSMDFVSVLLNNLVGTINLLE